MTYQPKLEHASDIFESYQIELGLYKLHEQMLGLASQSRTALRDAPDFAAVKRNRNRTPPSVFVWQFRYSKKRLKEATVTIGNTVDWDAISELYHPSEENFIDTPATWPVMGRAKVQCTANENDHVNGNGHTNGSPRVAAVTVEPEVEAATAVPTIEKAEPKTANRALLSSLGLLSNEIKNARNAAFTPSPNIMGWLLARAPETRCLRRYRNSLAK